MQQYLDLLQDILDNGAIKADRTRTGTVSVFGRQMRFNLKDGFPLLTTKTVHMKSIVHELIWFLKGETNIRYLNDHGVTIWDDWATEDGDLGPIYGKQWTEWDTGVPIEELEGLLKADLLEEEEWRVELASLIRRYRARKVNQLDETVRLLREKPDSRRLLVTGWNPSVLPDESVDPAENARQGRAALPPCHTFFQFYTTELSVSERLEELYRRKEEGLLEVMEDMVPTHEFLDTAGIPRRTLSCQFYCRSQDTFLGTPFNIASYALLTSMVAQVVDMLPGELIWVGGDVHLYTNHMTQVKEQLSRTPRHLPILKLNSKVKTLTDFTAEDITIENYYSWPAIKAPVAR